MKTVHFSFTTKLTFDDNVHEHSFALRVIPPETAVQHILSCDLSIAPYTNVQQTVDAFGNHVTAGYIREEHRFLDFSVKGTAQVDLSKCRTDFMPCYRYQSDFTRPNAALRDFYATHQFHCSAITVPEKAAYFSELLSDTVIYEKHATTTKTTAAESFSLGKGVCQDFAHLLVSLLRMDGIPARYIVGLAFCDGETHAWVEYWNADHWEGFDPANNCPVTEEYLVLSQGRDFGDCAIDRGVMLGNHTRQLQLVRSALT